ncbi:hypothetical protein C6989_03430 [Nitrosopumilus sp. b2]|nr:hypothetical protein C6989_03430 [Nitrosopumilus sp. b2]
MTAVCKGICDTLKSTGIAMKLKYQEGQKRCTLCEVFIDCKGNRCPCCRIRLRTKSRSSRSKLKRTNRNYQ